MTTNNQSVNTSFIEHLSGSFKKSVFKTSSVVDSSSFNDDTPKYQLQVDPLIVNSSVLEKLESNCSMQIAFSRNCLFEFFQIDLVQPESKVKEKTLQMIQKICQLSSMIPHINSEILRLTMEVNELKINFKNEKRKTVNIILSKERELEMAKQGLEELKESLKLRDENIKLEEENLRLKNKIENQGYLIQNLKRAKKASKIPTESDIYPLKKEIDRNIVKNTELTAKIDALRQQKIKLSSEVQDLKKKIKLEKAQLKAAEEEVEKKSDNLRTQKDNGMFYINFSENLKSDLDHILESIESNKSKILVLKKSVNECVTEAKYKIQEASQLDEQISELLAQQRDMKINQLLPPDRENQLSDFQKLLDFAVLPKSILSMKRSSEVNDKQTIFSGMIQKSKQTMRQSEEDDNLNFSEEQTICMKKSKPSKPQKIVRLKLFLKRFEMVQSSLGNQIELMKQKINGFVKKVSNLQRMMHPPCKTLGAFCTGSIENKKNPISFFKKNKNFVSNRTKAESETFDQYIVDESKKTSMLQTTKPREDIEALASMFNIVSKKDPKFMDFGLKQIGVSFDERSDRLNNMKISNESKLSKIFQPKAEFQPSSSKSFTGKIFKSFLKKESN